VCARARAGARVMDQCTFFFCINIYESGELPDPTLLGLATC